MSIVEKAAEKLRALQPVERLELPEDELPQTEQETVAVHGASTIERLQKQRRDAGRDPDGDTVVHIDEQMLVRAGLLPAEDEASDRLDNEIRRAKLPLLNNATGKSGKLPELSERIMVTSAVPGEGKTFTAFNLALSLAREPDFEVLLVDGDIPKFDVTRTLGLEESPGLMDVLTDEWRRPTDAIVRTDIPNLMVLPAGTRDPLAAELFGGRRMGYVLEELGTSPRQRLLVFDSAPLLAAPESRVLAALMGQVVLVVGAGHTHRHEVKAALAGLGDSQYVGLILNKSRLPATENPYYGYYGRHGQSIQRDRLRGH